MEVTRNWRDDNCDARRLKTLKTAIFIAHIISDIEYATVGEVTKLYRENVGNISSRTVGRYLRSLELMGVIEAHEDIVNSAFKKIRFSWIGWPESGAK